MPHDKIFDLIRKHAISVKASEYIFGRTKLSRISIVLPPCYEGTEWILMPKEVLQQLERELKLTELTLRLCYSKFLSVKYVNELIKQLSFEDKVEIAHRIVEEAIRVKRVYYRDGLFAVAFSGGKSSLAVLDLVSQHLDRDELVVLYEDTGLEFPGNTDYVIKTVTQHFKLRLVLVRPRVKPFQVWKLFGFPKESRHRYYEPACCLILKKLPAYITYTKYNVKCEFVGIQAQESRARMLMVDKGGLLRLLAELGGQRFREPIISALPIALWTEKEVWNYVTKRRLPVNPVYDRFGISRQGCMLCTNIITWRENLQRVGEALGRDLVTLVENFRRKFGIQLQKLKPGEVISKVLKTYNFKTIEDMYIIREYKPN